jgi:hypothetical protein
MSTAVAERVRQCRARQRNGEIRVTITDDELLLIEALVEARLLHRHQADDRGAITQALEKAVAAFCKERCC